MQTFLQMYNSRSHWCVESAIFDFWNGISPATMATPSPTRLQVISSDFNFNLTLSSRFCRFSITLFRGSSDRGVIIRYCWRQRKLYYEFSRAWLISPTFREVRGLNNHPYGFSVCGTELYLFSALLQLFAEWFTITNHTCLLKAIFTIHLYSVICNKNYNFC